MRSIDLDDFTDKIQATMARSWRVFTCKWKLQRQRTGVGSVGSVAGVGGNGALPIDDLWTSKPFDGRVQADVGNNEKADPDAAVRSRAERSSRSGQSMRSQLGGVDLPVYT
ncbi:hypothetical protein SPI_09097 [Niveomyces insectorum RCEF 264]|uniref:Uncharacterized protein n=1 Tax=Niveomyces insectorum RCEF 264 TaxID=1081102 RepID=A0A167MB95_9HYPO|nr:hypothetical protein SPI_09097 [Niveomyces insectorum RCEF 264]